MSFTPMTLLGEFFLFTCTFGTAVYDAKRKNLRDVSAY